MSALSAEMLTVTSFCWPALMSRLLTLTVVAANAVVAGKDDTCAIRGTIQVFLSEVGVVHGVAKKDNRVALVNSVVFSLLV